MSDPVALSAGAEDGGHGAEDHFEHWLVNRANAARDPISESSAKPYRYMWRAWCRWLASAGGRDEPVHWLLATSEHAQRYLQQGPSPAASTRKSRSAPISEITRQRYQRFLHILYMHALHRGLVRESPFAGAEEPLSVQEQSEGQIFHAIQLQAIAESLPSGTQRMDVRDRAIMCVLLDAAITTSELCQLRLQHVGGHLSKVSLSIDGKRSAQVRKLQLQPRASAALRHWMEIRRGITVTRPGEEDVVFVSKKGRAMTNHSIFHLVSTTVRQAFKAHHLDMPNHIGAQVLRNSRLVHWLNAGMPVDEVVRRAGFKDQKSFRGLRGHIDPAVLQPLRVRTHGPASAK